MESISVKDIRIISSNINLKSDSMKFSFASYLKQREENLTARNDDEDDM